MSFPWANHYEPKHPVMQWIDSRLPLPRLVYNSVGAGYPVPRNINYMYNFGVLAGVALMIQIITGVVLAMHYSPGVASSFASIEHIMRNVNSGWLIRYMHMNGASFFFIVVYFHIFRGLYYGSYKAPREVVWMLGVVILILMMATAFMGYVLPWGQMSFWGAQVITSLFSAIPLVGDAIRTWLVGGFAPDNATITRFFSLHYLLPFVILGVVILKIWALHIPGSTNPTGVEVQGPQDTLPFHPYFTAKDFVGICVYLMLFSAFVFFMPNSLGHPDNYIQANPLSTPAHIVPEWYLLPFYAILRAFTIDFLWVPAKLWGVIAMFASLIVLFFLPWLDTSRVKSTAYRPLYRIFFWVLLADMFLLGWVGAMPAEEPYVRIGQAATAYYFAHFLIIMPILSFVEKPLPLPNSIAEAVLGKKAARGGNSDGGSGGIAAGTLAPAE
jgi:ubiquinol-cytochrome c reductase cytochrome b subunit